MSTPPSSASAGSHTVDSSVLIAGFASWHQQHAAAQEALAGARMTAHSLLEAYSVLTRLPPAHRVPAPLAASFLGRMTTSAPLVLSGQAHAALLSRFVEWSVSGGAVYDALIAATAAEAGVLLLSLDARAAATYRAVGVAHRLLG